MATMLRVHYRGCEFTIEIEHTGLNQMTLLALATMFGGGATLLRTIPFCTASALSVVARRERAYVPLLCTSLACHGLLPCDEILSLRVIEVFSIQFDDVPVRIQYVELRPPSGTVWAFFHVL